MRPQFATMARNVLLFMSGSVFGVNAMGATPEVDIAGAPLIGGSCSAQPSFAPGTSSASGEFVAGTKISVGDGFIYQTGFRATKWSGSLKKFKLTLDPVSATTRLDAVAQWDAGEILTGAGGLTGSPEPDARKIFTARFGADRSMTMVEFKWDQLSDDQKALLNTSPADGKADGFGERRLNFLRGARGLEVGQPDGMFRVRDRVLGDIANSNPVYVGAPSPSVPGADYQAFYEANKRRAKAVYVGANDGMLHAFGAADGKELFAYVPNAVMPGMARLTSPQYVHRPYVDGAINIAEARIGAAWKTVLVSGMGGGAQGLFALDVTNPSDFNSGRGTLFEFTDQDDADMGNLAGSAAIAKFKMKSGAGTTEYKYFVVASSGFNNYKDDGPNRFDAAAPGALFLLSLDKSPLEKWQEGVNYFKFKTPIQDTGMQNGLSSPALTLGADGAVRQVYAGDLQGGLWRFDFTGSAPWPSALGTAPYQPIFTARDAQGNRQPITVQPRIAFAPEGGYVVLFGTGKFVENADTAAGNFKTQSFYGIIDSGKAGDRIGGRGELAERTLQKSTIDSADALSIAGDELVRGEGGQGQKGWYFDFLASDRTGERSVTDPLIAHGKLLFNTLIPGSDPCAPGGGRAYILDLLSGLAADRGGTGFLSQIGMMGSPILFENGPAEVGDRNAVGKRVVKKKYSVFNFGTGGAKGTMTSAPDGMGETAVSAGRISWREVLNWPELRDAFHKK